MITVWGIHAGRGGDADTLFQEKHCVAIGWHALGDLSKLQPNRDAFKSKVTESYPGLKPGAVPVNAGQLFRFVHEMKIGDFVVYPSKDRQVRLGQIDGDYRYDAKSSAHYPNTRSVKWLRVVPRTHFSQGALYEIGSAMSLFQVRNFAEEFRAAIEGKARDVQPAAQDETVAVVAKEIEVSTSDFILKRLGRDLRGLPFEGFVVHLLECMGYHARLTPTNEPSVDIIAHKDRLGIEPPIIKVQVKSGDGTVSDKDVSALYGSCRRANTASLLLSAL